LPAPCGLRRPSLRLGLIAYGPNRVDQYRRGTAYVDRIFKGEKAADLPVQACRIVAVTLPPALDSAFMVNLFAATGDEVIE